MAVAEEKTSMQDIRKDSIAAEKELVMIGRERVDGEVKRKADPTEELFGVLHRARRMGLSWEETASLAGISPTVLERWRREWPDKFEVLDAVVSSATIEVAHALYKLATGYDTYETDKNGNQRKVHVKGDTRAAIYWLEARGGWSAEAPQKNPPGGAKDLENMTDGQVVQKLTATVEQLNNELSRLGLSPPITVTGDDDIIEAVPRGGDGDDFEVEI